MPLWTMTGFFVYAMRRVNYPTYGDVVERVPWVEGEGQFAPTGIRFVCSDRWKPHPDTIAGQIPQALHVLDRFHIMRNMNVAIDEVRRREVAQLRRDGYEPALANSRWCLLKRHENLTDNQATKLAELLVYSLKSVRAHLLREEFQRFREYASPAWAGTFLESWCTQARRSRLAPMKKLATSLRRHRTMILSWFLALTATSAGAVEGFNGKAKLTTRKAHGLRTPQGIELALLHVMGNLPEPVFTIRFRWGGSALSKFLHQKQAT